MKLNKKKGIILASSVISVILIGVFFVIYETGPYEIYLNSKNQAIISEY